MKLVDAIKMYLLDSRLDSQSSKHLLLKERVLSRLFQAWCEGQGITDLGEVKPLVLKHFTVYLQEEYRVSDSDKRRSFRGRRLSPVSVKDFMRIIRAFFAWCEREECLEGKANPMRSVPKPKEPEFLIETLSPSQMQTILETCDLRTAFGNRNYAMFLVFMDTGIRVSELCGLKLAGVHDEYLTVFGKNKKEREVGISPATARALYKYIHQFRKALDTEEWVFVSRTGRKLGPPDVWDRLQEAGEQAGITGIRMSPHTLRHSYARAYLENGGELVKLSRSLGHSDLQTTMTYLKAFRSRDARMDHTKFSPVSVHKLGKHGGKEGKKKAP